MENKNINIAILGFGTIGSATYNNIYKNRDLIAGKTGLLLNVVKVLEKEPELFQGRVFDGCEITSDFSKILKDKSISIVVELMGGTTFAKECVLKLLAAGKHVVTANKALIAENISQIHEAVLKSKASFFFEGAVAGGIPVIA
ncbi:MAG: Homoserine dehydrogenase, partial [uncultured bacterium]